MNIFYCSCYIIQNDDMHKSYCCNKYIKPARKCRFSVQYFYCVQAGRFTNAANDENLSIETAQYTLLVCNWLTQCNLIFFRVTYLNFINKSALD